MRIADNLPTTYSPRASRFIKDYLNRVVCFRLKGSPVLLGSSVNSKPHFAPLYLKRPPPALSMSREGSVFSGNPD